MPLKETLKDASTTYPIDGSSIISLLINGCSNAGYDQGSYSRRSCLELKQGLPRAGSYRRGTANMALDGFEEILRQKFRGCKVNYTRYADDFVITGATKELLENEVKPVVVKFLACRGLILSDEKTVITHIDDGFDFLGFNVRSYKGKVLTKPSKAGIASILKKIKKIIRNNKQAKQENLIRLLNPVIRGWGNYYSHVVSKNIFSYIDHRTFEMLRKWARRRHSKKSRRWVDRKYFGSVGNRNWVFKTGNVELTMMAKIPIIRHIKIRKDANPFDTDYDEYFRKRSFYHLYKDDTNVHLEDKE